MFSFDKINKHESLTHFSRMDDLFPITSDHHEVSHKNNTCCKRFILGILLGVVIYVILDYTIPSLGFVDEYLKYFLEWVEENPALGAVSFAAVYVFTTICFIPGIFLTLGSGLVFGRALGIGLGVMVGSLVVITGAVVSAIVSFLLGRFVLKHQAQELFDRFMILKAIDKAIEAQGKKLVFLLRLSPVVPFSVFNYVMGVTAINLKDYVLSCIGMIPGTVAYVFVGTTASSILGGDSEEESGDGQNESMASMVQLVVIIVGAVSTLLAVVLVSVYSKRALNKALEEESRRNTLA